MVSYYHNVIRYNGSMPTKLNIWPKIENFKADVKYMELAQLIGLNPKTPAEGVQNVCLTLVKNYVTKLI